jgi:REP element-mobilizing transposase RayT
MWCLKRRRKVLVGPVQDRLETHSFFLSTAGKVSQESIQRYIERLAKT